MIRVMKLVSRYYHNGGPQLNKVGLYHLRSYVLQELGFLHEVNTWEGMSMRHEPREVQEAKRQAWLQTQAASQVQEVETESDTDVED